METAPLLRLNGQQVEQLIGYCATYRSYLWQCVLPTLERNQNIRSIQALQGRLEKVQEQGQDVVVLSLTGEEKNALKQLLGGLVLAYGAMPASEQRTKQLGEIGVFRTLIERMLRQTQAL